MSSDDHDERTCAVALALTNGVGWKLIHRLLDRFGTLETALNASTAELQTVPGIGQQIAASIHAIDLSRLNVDLRRFDAQGITLAIWQDPIYPERLKTLADKPLVLFWKGAFHSADEPTIAIVGTRVPAASSVQRAYQLAAAFARRGWVVISGLARGIDTAAHRGALLAGGRTLAVLGCGVNVVYPPENWRLAGQVRANGALISEVHPDAPPTATALMRRNRLIAGLSRAVIVVEAPDDSGALHAARYAHEQSRPVFALDNSAGNAALLRDFASPVPDDIDTLLSHLEPPDSPS
jgi:DNA processing protein